MRVRGSVTVHFVFESLGALSDDRVRQAICACIGTQTTAYDDVMIRTEAVDPEDVAVERGVDA